jgi:hypothetical protein
LSNELARIGEHGVITHLVYTRRLRHAGGAWSLA